MTPSEAPTTLLETIRLTAPRYKQYRTLVAAPGEPHVVREDLLGAAPADDRASRRRSLTYLGHLSDIHVMDAQSPARLEPMAGQSASLWAGVVRPQDTLTLHVTAAMVAAMSAARVSPVTGAPMAAAVVTGDVADQLSQLELEWYISSLDGQTVTPDSGQPGVYEGVQVWDEATYAYHPDNPDGDWFGEYGFPRIPGMLEAAISSPVESVGLPVPWYAVYGNHDTTLNGTFSINSQLKAWALGSRKASTWTALGEASFEGLAMDTSPFGRLVNSVMNNFGFQPGIHSVTPDPARKLLEQTDFMAAHFQTTPVPGPVGHGFTQRNLDTGETWWSADISPYVRAFGLDTCNQVAGPDGAVPQSQFDWLKGQLAQAQAENKLCVVLSHHNSTTLENGATAVFNPGEKLYHAEEFVAMLNEFPNMVAWVNGHTHINTIFAHHREGGGGFWEITTASCIDFPQQQQMIEIVDNRDGTLSIFTTTLDHASPAAWTEGDLSAVGLASLSRELSANDWIENPPMRLGSPLDRNCELLLPAPFDLSTITDADLERAHAEQRARLVAYEQGQPS
ncbi:MAG: TIGR03767 family metallophosphoesterase [Candidatus Nanopelagicales bacterium]